MEGEGGGGLPCPFLKRLEKSALILWKNALSVAILGYASHLKCNF